MRRQDKARQAAHGLLVASLRPRTSRGPSILDAAFSPKRKGR